MIDCHQIIQVGHLPVNPVFSRFGWHLILIPLVIGIKFDLIEFNLGAKLSYSTVSNRFNLVQKTGLIMIDEVEKERFLIDQFDLKGMPLH